MTAAIPHYSASIVALHGPGWDQGETIIETGPDTAQEIGEWIAENLDRAMQIAADADDCKNAPPALEINVTRRDDYTPPPAPAIPRAEFVEAVAAAAETAGIKYPFSAMLERWASKTRGPSSVLYTPHHPLMAVGLIRRTSPYTVALAYDITSTQRHAFDHAFERHMEALCYPRGVSVYDIQLQTGDSA